MEILIYLLKVSACTALFFGFYLMVLMEAVEIVFNNKTQMGSAKNLVLTQVNSDTKMKALEAKFNLNGKIEFWQSSGGNLIVEP